MNTVVNGGAALENVNYNPRDVSSSPESIAPSLRLNNEEEMSMMSHHNESFRRASLANNQLTLPPLSNIHTGNDCSNRARLGESPESTQAWVEMTSRGVTTV